MDKSTINILLVEDDEGDILLAKRMLTNCSEFVEFTVESAKSLSEAVKYLSNDKKYDVALLDMGLPDSRGIETVRRVRQVDPYIPIVVLTGLDDEETGCLAIQNGASDYLVKGKLLGDMLVRTIIFAIERKQVEEERERMLFFQLGINSLQQSLLKAIPLEEKLKKVTDDIVKFFGADFCRIWLIKNGDMCQQGCVHAEVTEGPHVCRYRDRCLHLVSSSGRYTHIDGKTHRRIPFGCYKIGLIASGEEHKLFTNDVQNDPHVHNHEWARELGLVSFAGYQLRLEGGQALGVLALFSRHPIDAYKDAMLDGISGTVAMAIQQALMSKQLQESEVKYRGLFESSHDAIMTIEPPSWNFTSCNPATLKLFKVETVEKFTLFGLGTVSPLRQPDGCSSVEKAKEMIEKAVKEDSCFFEWTHKRINGEEFPATILLARMERGGKIFVQATIRDITAQKRAEEELRWKTAFLESQVEATLDGMLVVDGQGQRIITNKRLIDMWKVPQHIVEDKDDTALLNFVVSQAKYPEQFLEKIKYLYSHQNETSRDEIEFKNGLVMDRYSSPVADKDGKYFGRIWTFHDITNRKRAEEALRRERNKAQKYLDVAGVMLLVLNSDITIHRINDKGCKILEYAENELIGKNWCDNFIPPEYRKEVSEVIKGLMSGEINKYEYHENPILTKSGEQRLIAWHNVVMWDETEKIYAILFSGEDITERKESEETIEKAYKDIKKANVDLKSMQAQLVQSEKLASIGQLAAGVAHEMNTPVGFTACNFETLEKYTGKFKKLIGMYTQMACEIPTIDKTRILTKCTEIKQAAEDMKIDIILEDVDSLFKESKEGLDRVTTIIQNLRDFSRIDQAESFNEFNINQGIEVTLAVARNTIKYHANVITEFSNVPHVPCNGSQINQVFLNILVNAAQAIESQNRGAMGCVKVKTYSNDTYVICEIEDDGPGIPQEYIKKVFDPFFTTKPAGKGTGLGLAVSYDIIVNKHKGELLVDSVVGKGSKFTLKLPIKTAKEETTNDSQIPADAAANI